MTKLELWFVESGSVHLEKTSFSHPLLDKKQEAYRGKSSGAFANSHSFQWSPAVRSLSLLLLQTAAWSRNSKDADPLSAPRLVGADHTLASSLDYAVSKLPLWLMDMFGLDSRGNALARRLIRRTNPERRRGGNCVLALNLNMLPADKIHIFLNEQAVHDGRQLELLSTKMMAAYGTKRTSTPLIKSVDGPKSGPSADTAPSEDAAEIRRSFEDQAKYQRLPAVQGLDGISWWRGVVRADLQMVLQNTGVFNRAKYRQDVSALCADQYFRRLSNGRGKPASDFDLNLPISGRLGIQANSAANRRALEACSPLRVAITVDQFGSLAIFKYLKHMRHFEIEVNFGCLTSSEMVKSCISGDLVKDSDACILSPYATAAVLAAGDKSAYRPFMLMPKTSRRVVAPKKSGKNKNKQLASEGHYIFMRDSPSGGLMYFNRLMEQGCLKAGAVKTTHMELDEMGTMLSEGDPDLRAVIWFPFYRLHQAFNNCLFVDQESCRLGLQDSVLMVHERLLKNSAFAEALAVVIRGAWMELREDTAERELIAELLVQDPGHLKLLKRACGIKALAA
ncbi:MAG: hypothetical protein GX589_09865 [Deltaproteobacteria bacterium]|nr:hypothetical protein [Deltaproteobacteria bacterium]